MAETPSALAQRDAVTGKDIDQDTVVTLRRTYPQQLRLWQTSLPGDNETEDYSNTVELYDAVPKYFASKKRMAELRKEGQFLTSLKRNFKHRGKDYQVKITPARVEEKDGSEREYYPSWREELVEEALKKIACEELRGVYLNETAGVQFTLYELRRELENRGHGIHYDDLIKALTICRRANIVIAATDRDGNEVVMDSSIFPTLIITKRRDWEKNPKGTRCYVQFNPLVTHSINKLAYRQFDYAKFMTFKRQLARWFYKRLAHNYLQASLTGPPFHIKMSTVVRDSALVNASRLRDKMRSIDEALDELVEREILYRYDKEPMTGVRGKIENIAYMLHPHIDFIAQVKRANKRAVIITDAAKRAGILDEEAYAVHMHKSSAQRRK